jgi:hypothetical protein
MLEEVISTEEVELPAEFNSIVFPDDLEITRKKEIISAVYSIAAKVPKWAALANAVEVQDHYDRSGMKSAKESRLIIYRERNDAVNHIKSNIETVKAKMYGFEVEIKAWKDVMTILQDVAKSFESQLKFKEMTYDRWAETEILKARLDRIERLGAYVNNPEVYIKDDLTESDFLVLLDSMRIQKEASDKMEAMRKEEEEKAEKERIEKENRKTIIADRRKQLWQYKEVIDVEYSDEEIFDFDAWNDIFNAILPEKYIAHNKRVKEQEERSKLVSERRIQLGRHSQVFEQSALTDDDLLNEEFYSKLINIIIPEKWQEKQKADEQKKLIEHRRSILSAFHGGASAITKYTNTEMLDDNYFSFVLETMQKEEDEFNKQNEKALERRVHLESLGAKKEVLLATMTQDDFLNDDVYEMAIQKYRNKREDELAQKRLQSIVEQRKQLEPYNRFIVVQKLIEKAELIEEELFNNILNVTIPGLIEKEKEIIPIEDINPEALTLNMMLNNIPRELPPIDVELVSIEAQELHIAMAKSYKATIEKFVEYQRTQIKAWLF